jgi:hypothetical protein
MRLEPQLEASGRKGYERGLDSGAPLEGGIIPTNAFHKYHSAVGCIGGCGMTRLLCIRALTLPSVQLGSMEAGE